MNFNKISNLLSTTYILDPYSKLMHYRKALKVLKCFGEERGRILVVGNKHRMGFDYAQRFPGLRLTQSGLDEATNHLHSLIDVARIEATPVVLVGNDPVALIRETSGNSSVVFLGFEPPTKDDENDFRQGIEYMTGNFQTTILVSSADDVELNV